MQCQLKARPQRAYAESRRSRRPRTQSLVTENVIVFARTVNIEAMRDAQLQSHTFNGASDVKSARNQIGNRMTLRFKVNEPLSVFQVLPFGYSRIPFSEKLQRHI